MLAIPPELSGLSRQTIRLNASRASAEDAMEQAALAALDWAVSLLKSGDRQGALQLCATVVLQNQPIIGARIKLLRRTLYALLVIGGFKLLSRLVTALSGRGTRVVLLSEDAEPIAPPRGREEAHQTVYAIDPRWLAELSPDDRFIRRWSDALSAEQRVQRPAVTAAAPEPGFVLT